MDYQQLADLLFPNVTKSWKEYLDMYPERNLPKGAEVLRMAPSPTGFIHLGNLYGALADERIAHQSNGVFYLRIEDTDLKRKVEGAVETVISCFDYFQIHFDEGAHLENGKYGPYYQRQRAEIYQAFAKKLVSEGKAYPCFLSEEEIADIRAQQEAAKETTGIYGKYAEKNRNLTYEEIEANISAGKPYVVRLKSDGDTSYFKIMDAVRGEVSMPGNNQDTIILKANGIPTYHFAHVIDDHLMGTTHVVRGEEWLMSLPIHVELFSKLGFEMPVYCHTAVLMKVDEETGNKRKLSKRKDPELSLDYYRKQGYHPQAVKEYLLTILNSNFEEWRMANPDADIDEFDFTTEKMSSAGALFDLNKLNDISKDVLLKIPADELADFILGWAKEFKPQIAPLLEDRDYLTRILDLGRDEAKPRKDLIYASQIWDFISYFYDDYFVIQERVPEQVSDEDAKEILSRYLDTYDHSDDQSAWFEKIRTITADLGYAVKPKDYKKHPEEYKGSVAHVSTVIRIAVMGRSQSPDVWSIQQILGEDKVRSRISQLIG